MPRRHVLLLALLAALAAAPPAHAKRIDALTACGADGCRDVTRAIGQALHELGGVALATRPRPAPHFRLVMRIGDGHRTLGTDRLIYVPSARAVGGEGGWSRLDRGAAAKLDRTLAKRRPLPATKLPGTAQDMSATEAVPAPAAEPPATAGADVGWRVGGTGGVAAILALALWRIRRGRALRASG
jgi:hypothetical protein